MQTAKQRAKPMVVVMGSVTNAMWPIRDVQALERSAQFARSLGVDVYESYTPWIVFEPEGPGKFDWTETDKLDGVCRRTGLQWQAFVMLNPSYATPDWFRKSSEEMPHRCMEHQQNSDVRSIWCRGLDRHVDRILGALFGRYNDSPGLESVMFGVSGDFGESIYPAGAVGWNGQYHNHAGFWCAEEPARLSLVDWAHIHYDSVRRLNQAWGSSYASFDDIHFLHPDNRMSDTRWLDQAEWYRGEMTRWCEVWFQSARRHARNGLPLYLCVGGGDSVPLGFDITGQSRLCAKYDIWLRLTNEGSVYVSNFMGTRQLTTAAKLYGVPSGLEPAGDVNVRGVPSRIFGAAAAGCNHIHYYEGQIANLNACSDAEGRTEAWRAEREHLVIKPPYVNVAAFYPRIDALTKRQMGAESINRYHPLRDYIDFDFVDDNLTRDAKLDRYRYLLMSQCATLDEQAYNELRRWIHEGGVLIAAELGAVRVWRPQKQPAFQRVAALAPRPTAWASLSVQAPARFAWHPGNPPATVELTGNWSHPEGELRWGGRDAGFNIPVDPSLDYILHYEGGVPRGGEVLANGRVIGRMDGRAGNEHTWTFPIPSGLLKGSSTLRVQFRMEPMRIATDSRDLCVYPRTITLEAPGGNDQLNAPRISGLRIDDRLLNAATRVIGKGRVIAMPAGLTGTEYARTVTALLRRQLAPHIPVCAIPDGEPDAVYMTCRGDELLVYNGGDHPISTRIQLPAGAELDRTHRVQATQLDIHRLAPDAIESYPLHLHG